MLVTVRTSEDTVIPFDLTRVPFVERVARIEVGPLTFGAVRHLLLSRTDLRLTRPLIRRIHETSGGNPFFALELARALARRQAPLEPGEPLPVPADLHSLLAESVAGLPPETREALVVVALLARPSLEAVARATGCIAEDVLRPALDTNIVELSGSAIVFAHPLLRATVHAEATAAERMRWHRRLVEAVSDQEERAQHLAVTSLSPDETVARELESAGARARRRGAPVVAAGLLEHAIRLTPEGRGEELALRRIAAADAWLESGDRLRAVELWQEVEKTIAHGPLRADALVRLADMDNVATEKDAIALAEEALNEAAGDGRREVGILLRLANLEHQRAGWPAAVDYATRALRVAESLGDLGLEASALTGLGIYETFLGTGDPAEHYRRAVELDARADGKASRTVFSDAYWAPQTMLSDWLRKDGELDEGRSLLEEQHRRAVEAGDEYSRLFLCIHLAELETSAGAFEAADGWNDEAMALAEESEADLSRNLVLASMAVLQAYRGDLPSARLFAEEAMAFAEAHGNELLIGKLRAILCFVELSAGRPKGALAELGPLRAEPITSVFPFAGDGVEALLATGEIEEAGAVLAKLELYAEQTGLRMFRLLALRCRGLHAAEVGDLERALETLETADALAAELPFPLERGRTLLLLGQARRRAKQRRDAREALAGARAAFVAFGAAPWAERADSELGRIGGRTRERWELTSTEQRVAELVAQGLTNKEVAGALVVSVRAVEANLTRIYAKLGVRSRTELTHMLTQKGMPEPQA